MIKTDINELKYLVEAKSPYDSNICLSLTQGSDNLYYLRFSLISQSLCWEWTGANSNEDVLVSDFKESFFSQLQEWWKHRFDV